MFTDLSNIFLIQSLLFSTFASNVTPVCHLWYVNYFTPFPRNMSLGRLWSDHDVACGEQKLFSALFHPQQLRKYLGGGQFPSLKKEYFMAYDFEKEIFHRSLKYNLKKRNSAKFHQNLMSRFWNIVIICHFWQLLGIFSSWSHVPNCPGLT